MFGSLQALFGTPQQVTTPMFTVHNGTEQPLANRMLTIHGPPYQKTIATVDTQTNAQVTSMAQAGVIELLTKMTLIHFFADYHRVKEHQFFRQIYGHAQRNVNFCQADGTVAPQMVWTFPCIRCGVVLPEWLITIDHQKPQAGGELLALLKVFRVFGLTEGGPVGMKGQQMAARTASFGSMFRLMMGENAVPTIHPRANPPAAGKAARLTLSPLGAMIYSALREAGDMPQLLDTCMHSVVNLKPLCLRCNTTKGNSVLG